MKFIFMKIFSVMFATLYVQANLIVNGVIVNVTLASSSSEESVTRMFQKLGCPIQIWTKLGLNVVEKKNAKNLI